jgi:RNA polymerase sigma-70 factor (ECF subfamily)
MRQAYGWALGWVGAPEAALDLSQEAFARTWRSRDRLDPTRPYFPWLYRTLRRLCMNHLRDERTRGRRLTLDGALIAREGPGDPAELAAQGELRARCRAAIAELPEREREVLTLREYQGLKYQEIADLLEIPLGTVMSRLYSARRRLATALEGAL